MNDIQFVDARDWMDDDTWHPTTLDEEAPSDQPTRGNEAYYWEWISSIHGCDH